MKAAVGKKYSNLGTYSESRKCKLSCLLRVLIQSFLKSNATELNYKKLTHSFVTMSCDNMSYLMSNDNRKALFGLGNRKHSFEHTYFSARHCKCIYRGIIQK